MEFVTPWMLLGLAAVAIPVIIHLLNRKSARTVDWGAYRFLLDALVSRKSRILIEEMLLLATRCLLVALLALALARPFLQPGSRIPWAIVLPMMLLSVTLFGVSFAMWRYRAWRRRLTVASAVLGVLAIASVLLERHLNLSRFGSGAQRDVVIIVDGSSSMTMMQGAEDNFSRARSEAETYIKEAPKGTAFGLIVGGPVPRVMTPAPMTDRRELYSALDAMTPINGTMDIMASLTAATVMLASGNNPAKQIVVVGDGQAAGWYGGAADRWNLASSILGSLKMKPQIVWRTLPLPSSIRNMAVSGVSLTRDVVGTDRPVGIRVTVSNSGSEAVTPEEVRVQVDEKTYSNKSVRQLEPGASHTVTFMHRFADPGTHVVNATVVAADDLPADDTLSHVVQVIDALKVLVVDGNPAGAGFEKASAFLSLALRPEAIKAAADSRNPQAAPSAAEERGFLVEPEVVDAPLAARREGFADCGVIMLADVAQLPDQAAARIARFVSNGGGLFIGPGARANPEFYNAWTHQGETVLPLPMGELATASSETNRPAVAPSSFQHDSLRGLRTGTDLQNTLAARHWKLDEGSLGSRVIARFDNGDPFLAIRKLDRGYVVLSAIPFDASLSTLPSRGCFLPLVHELTYFLSNPTMTDLNFPPSEGIVIPLSGGNLLQNDPNARGLQAQYFPGNAFAGRPQQRIDNAVEFNFASESPFAGIDGKRFSVRWTGSIIPRLTGTYTVRVDAKGGSASIWVGGRPGKTFNLKAGEPVDLRVDFDKTADNSSARLLWRLPNSKEEEVIPRAQLTPYRNLVTSSTGLEETTEILGPDGSVLQGVFASTGDGLALRIAQGLVPGLYEIKVPSSHIDTVRGILNKSKRIPFCVSAGTAESDITAMDNAGLSFIRGYVDLLTATKAEDVLKALAGETFGKEIWRTLAFAALVLFVLEIALTRWIAIQRRTGVEEKVSFEETGTNTAGESFREELAKMRGA